MKTTYSEAVAYLHRLTDYGQVRIQRYKADAADLSRIEGLLEELGNPHRDFRSVHIAGTKGKGSTSAMCESCLRAAGYRTGFYTSPHLHTFRERIRVAGRMISREDVADLVDETRSILENVDGLTTFEAITALGFLHFSRAEIDVAVVEVGLGGRLDATNVLMPDVSVITSLSLDHTYLLGDTLAQIAFEKAGIIKPGVPVISAPQPLEGLDVIEDVSQDRQSPLQVVGRDWLVEPESASLAGQRFDVACLTCEDTGLTGGYEIPLLGSHQLENATMAVAALDALRGRGFPLTREVVAQGLRTVHWPGRLEVLSRAPLVVVDCAHNPYSVGTLVEALNDIFPGQRWVLVYGASIGKDVSGMLETLLPLSDYTIVSRSDHPRAAAPIGLADTVAQLGGGAEVTVDISAALDRALAVMTARHGLLVTGSVFVVADAREEWARQVGATLPGLDHVQEG